MPVPHDLPSPRPRASSARILRPPTAEAAKLQGVVELTSIIHTIDPGPHDHDQRDRLPGMPRQHPGPPQPSGQPNPLFLRRWMVIVAVALVAAVAGVVVAMSGPDVGVQHVK